MVNEAKIKHTSPLANEVDITAANASLAPVALSKKLNVITSVSPLTNIVKNIGGDQIHLIGIIPEGAIHIHLSWCLQKLLRFQMQILLL